MSDKIAIKVEDLTIAYNHTPVLWDIDLTVQKGVLMAIVGSIGATTWRLSVPTVPENLH